jgi:hypothetical protein
MFRLLLLQWFKRQWCILLQRLLAANESRPPLYVSPKVVAHQVRGFCTSPRRFAASSPWGCCTRVGIPGRDVHLLPSQGTSLKDSLFDQPYFFCFFFNANPLVHTNKMDGQIDQP